MNTMQVRIPDMENLFREVDSYISPKEKDQPPRIGISSNRKDGLSCIAEPYVESVVKAGGAPILIPVITDIAALTSIVNTLDGLILSGGGDLNPLFVKEEPIPQLQDADSYRDEYDLILLRLASNRQIPIMGICRGHQIINIAFGGTNYQDLYSQSETKRNKHSQSLPREQASHSIELTKPGSLLSRLLSGKKNILVNSFHHQSIRKIAPEFISTAKAPDGINEAMEHPEKAIFSVQWHPETMAANNDEIMLELFRHQVRSSQLFSQAKDIHRKIISLDSHTDTPMVFPGQFNLGIKQGGKVNLPYMEEGLLDAVCMVAYLPQGKRDAESLQAATDFATERLQEIRRQAILNPDRMGIARSAEDIYSLKSQQKKAVLLGIENGYALGKDLQNIDRFKEMGVTYITLCHNGNNDICDSARDTAEWNGLSTFGKQVISKMNKMGMIIDVSHAAESTFYDVMQMSKQPVVATHSCVRTLCDHPRNLTDYQIKTLAEKRGVLQICLYKGFLRSDSEKASLTDVIRHINHVVNLVGVDHVGIGSDFDGDGEVIGCRAANELMNITVRLLQEGYTEEDIRKIWGGNFLRVLSAVREAAIN